MRLDPFGTIDLLHQALKDLALTREQQEVFERVVSCNARFWQIAVDGCLDGSPPWRRHVALNLALLRVYHRHLAAQRIVDELTSPLLGSLSYPEAVEALRYCRWALAAYSGRGLRDGTEKIQSEGTSKMAAPVNANMPDEEERVVMAAAVAECSPSSVLLSDLDDTAQASDPLCPRFLLAEDVERGELIISVRGTQSLSDLFADLVGDAEDFAGLKPEHVRCHFVTTKDHHVVLRSCARRHVFRGRVKRSLSCCMGRPSQAQFHGRCFLLDLKRLPATLILTKLVVVYTSLGGSPMAPSTFRWIFGQVRANPDPPPLSAISPLLRSSFSFLQQSSANCGPPPPPPP